MPDRRLLSVTAVALFASTVLVCCRASTAEPTPISRWTFAPPHTDGQWIKPTVGTLSARVTGRMQFDDAVPKSLLLDGKSQRVIVSENLAEAKLPVRAITAEAWVTVDRPQPWGGLLGAIQDNGSYERGWLLGYRSDKFCFAVSSTGKKRLTYLTADQSFVPGSWYHVAGVYDGKTMSLYVDGRLAAVAGDQSGDILYPPKAVFEIAAYHDDNEHYPLAGRLAEVSVWNQALSTGEIKARFDAQKKRFPQIEETIEAENVVGWPTYLRDNARSGLTKETLALPLHLAWSYQARHAPQPAWPPPAKQDFWHNKVGLKARVIYDRAFQPVSDGHRVYFGSSSDDQVRCLDLATGKTVWSFFTEGPVRLAPTLSDGRVYFGSDDGAAYCLRADDGSLIWIHRPLETDRRIPGNSRIISTWPLRSGMLIENGRARLAAGLFPNQGTYQFVLDAKTGKQLAKGTLNFSPQGYMRQEGNRLTVAQGRSPQAFLDRLQRSGKTVTPTLGKLPEQFPFAFIGAGNVRFGGGDGQVAALSADDGRTLWSAKVQGRAFGLAVAGNRLLVSTDAGMIYCFSSAPINKPVQWKPPAATPLADSKTQAAAARVVSRVENLPGYCLLLGHGQEKLAAAIAQRSKFRVILRMEDPDRADAARRDLDRAGLYGWVVVHTGSLESLPYGTGLFNLVVAPAAGKESPTTPAGEIRRVLRPEGIAWIESRAGGSDALRAWSKELDVKELAFEKAADTGTTLLVVRRPPLTGTGHWSHIYGDVSNTACSGDRRVGGSSLRLQWFGPPGPRQMLDRHHRTVPPLFTDGRLFIPGNNRVVAVDAYNGAVLWNSPVAGSRRVAAMRDAGSMAATRDTLYIAAGDRCYGLDTKSGESKLNFPVSLAVGAPPRDWGYVARVDDMLVGSSVMPRASRNDHSRQQISQTYWDFVPIVTSDAVFCLDRHKGTSRWRYQAKAGAIVNPTITIGGGRVYFVESNNEKTLTEKSGRSKLSDLVGKEAELVALDLNSGKLLWRRKVDLSAIQHHLYLCYSKEKLVAVGSKNRRVGRRATVWYDLHAFSATDGKPLWNATQNQNQGVNGDHGEQDHHPVIVGDTVYQEPYAYDLASGKRREGWKFARGGHGCGTISASAQSLFFRAGNPTMCDLGSGKNSKVTRVSRPGCWINIIPAGGLLLIPEASSGCTCNFSIQTSLAFAPEDFDKRPTAKPKPSSP